MEVKVESTRLMNENPKWGQMGATIDKIKGTIKHLGPNLDFCIMIPSNNKYQSKLNFKVFKILILILTYLLILL